MQFVNLTPHEINVEVNGKIKVFKPSGAVARLGSKNEGKGTLQGIPLNKTVYSGLEVFQDGELVRYDFAEYPHCGCAECNGGYQTHDMAQCFNGERYIYIVSQLVAQYMRRENVVSPDSGPTAQRDEKGQIKFVRGFLGW